ISQAVQEGLNQVDILLLSGGLGPTRDDITKHTLSDIFGGDWHWDEETVAFLEERAQLRNRPLNERTRQQAYVPTSCTVLPNRMGTAPGMLFEQAGKQVFVMPGVPYEMLHLLETQVIPRLQAAHEASVFQRKVLRIANVPESEAARRIEPLEDAFPSHLSLSYLPREDGLWLELVSQASKEQAETAKAELVAQFSLLQGAFAKEWYADSEASIASLLLDLLKANNKQLAVAESITGGRITAEIVSVSGASEAFRGSVTAYATDLKSSFLEVPVDLIATHGVVSEAVAKAMAESVRKQLGADVGLATTGIAEGTDEESGQVWIGFSSANGQVAKQVPLIYNRQVNLRRATQYALQFCLQNFPQTLG
ncbi:MAG: nicotinamide-nucleotide amidohydrolase family protein, partial [Bacteroidota bacterium]